MALFGFLKKETADTPLIPPKPPSGVAPLSSLSALDDKLPKAAPPPPMARTVQTLPPLPGLTQTKPEAPRTPMAPLSAMKPVEDTRPPLTSQPVFRSSASMPDIPKPAQNALPPMPELPRIAPSVQPAAIPPVIKSSNVPPPPAFSPRPNITDQFNERPKLPALPPVPKQMPDIAPARPLPALGDMPRISVREESRPMDPFSMPPIPKQELAPKMPETIAPARAPEPLKRENSRLAKVLEELTVNDFDLPPLTPMRPMPDASPAFQPQMARARTLRPGRMFLTLHQFEETATEINGSEQHLHNLQTHNEKLGIIETHTKNELETLITVFEILERQLLAMDDKLFTTEGEYL